MDETAPQEKYMKEAIRQARKASAIGEVPIGCVIEYQGKIIGRGYNRRMVDKTVLAHAEIIAIRKACKAIGDWRLEGCTIYFPVLPVLPESWWSQKIFLVSGLTAAILCRQKNS